MSIDLSFNDSLVDFNNTIKAEGAFSDYLKMVMKTLSSDRQKDFIRDYHKKTSSSIVQIRALEVSDVTNPKLSFRAPAVIEFSDNRIQTAPYYSVEFSFQSLIGFFTDLNILPQPENRKNAYLFPYPFQLVLDSVCPPPRKGMRPDTLPQNLSIETPFLTFKSEYVKDGESVQSKHIFVIKQTRIEREQYKQFYESVQEVLKKSYIQINFVYKKGETQTSELEEAVKKEPENVKAHLNLAKDRLRKGRYKEAKELLDKSVLLEPNNGEIHYLLGIAAGSLDLFEESKKELSKAKELGYKP
jgi:tetratricopeptide (TPR) repeat protein